MPLGGSSIFTFLINFLCPSTLHGSQLDHFKYICLDFFLSFSINGSDAILFILLY